MSLRNESVRAPAWFIVKDDERKSLEKMLEKCYPVVTKKTDVRNTRTQSMEDKNESSGFGIRNGRQGSL